MNIISKKFRRVNYQKGQAVITSVVFFLFISLTLVLGISGSSVRELKVAEQALKSKQGFYAAESGVEDVTYRIKTGKQTSASEALFVGGATTTTTVTDLGGGQKEVLSSGDFDTFIRKVRTVLTLTTGNSFNYGVQAGAGGVSMANNSQVTGNLYSNGDITGQNGSVVTGTAIAANSAALFADQTNDAPVPPAYDIAFGSAAGTQDFAQSFTVSTTSAVNKVQLYLKRTSSSPSNLTVRIVPDNGGVPDDSFIVSGSLAASLVTTSYGWVEVPFSQAIDMMPGATYWIVLDGSTSANKYYSIGGNTGYINGTAKLGQYDGAWQSTSPSGLDGYFKVYLGGQTGIISGITVGQNGTGNAWAHTVNGSTVAGALYCQSGSGNNKACDTSQSDPAPQAFSVSQGNVDNWQEDAAAGQTIAGDYHVSSNTTLGPAHITGNLLVDNGATLTLSGTVWVSGTATFSNNARIRLASSYGSFSGILLSNGRIEISNGATFAGSGQAGSYLLVLTTSRCPNDADCSGEYALEVANNAGAVILNAIYGSLHLANNSGAKEATANRIVLDPGATITYESGLANVNFSSGPGGSFNVDKWREVR